VLEELYHEFELGDKLKAEFSSFLAAYQQTNLLFWSKYYKKEIDKKYLRNNRFNETFKIFGYNNYNENLVITEHYLNRAPHGIFLKEGCIEILEYLKNKYTLHVITNGFREIQGIKIDGCGLRQFFSNVIISEEHELTKPDEKIFRLAEKLAATTAADCVMIGDSYESDIIGAVNAGWDAVYFTDDNLAGYDGKLISNLLELREHF
jgi:putative hydrolase of the HAD superfamily